MNQFTTRHEDRIQGVLHGFDRMLFRGTLRSISYVQGMDKFLTSQRVLLKDFAVFARECTATLTRHIEALASDAGRPLIYMPSSSQRKENLVAEIVQRDAVKQGLICVLTCVEPCMSFDVHRNHKRKRLELVARQRKCKHFYLYFMDPMFGLMHVRLQSWLPLDVQVCINGRSYLAQQMSRGGMTFEQADNCFTHIDDLPRAQRMLDRLGTLNWRQILDKLVRPLNPLLRRGGMLFNVFGYYWTMRQHEYATDVMFKNAASLQAIYPDLCRHAIDKLRSPDVLRFLGKKPVGRFSREVTGHMRHRLEGVRVKHCVGSNSIKMYDKQQMILRIETTMNDPRMFRVFRRAEGNEQSPLLWRLLRKSVADMKRRIEISRAANERYLEAMSVVDTTTPVHLVLDPISQRTRQGPSRALRPIAPDDAALFHAIMRGEHLLNGFASHDVQRRLFRGLPRNECERRRRTNRVSYLLRMLRHHGLIRKVPRRRLYRVTPKGHAVMSTAITLRNTHAELLKAA
jgi:hypothetical protein